MTWHLLRSYWGVFTEFNVKSIRINFWISLSTLYTLGARSCEERTNRDIDNRRDELIRKCTRKLIAFKTFIKIVKLRLNKELYGPKYKT